jgi:hypothetical protein
MQVIYNDINSLIFSNIKAKDLLSLRLVCKGYKNVIDGEPFKKHIVNILTHTKSGINELHNKIRR